MKPYELPDSAQAPIRQQAQALAVFADYELHGALYVLRYEPQVLENAIMRVANRGVEEAEKFLEALKDQS